MSIDAGEDLHREGYPGKTTEFLAGQINDLYRKHPADVVLLYSGHNHSIEEKPVGGIIESTQQIIGTIRQINPRVIILLAQVIPSGKLPKCAYIPRLNDGLRALSIELNTRESPVILVDQATGFDINTDTVADRVHPNQAGAQKMAENWWSALQPILSASRDNHLDTMTKPLG